MAIGIRVKLLALELGVESRSILLRLRDEGMGDRVTNHMSLVPFGLADTIRQWFPPARAKIVPNVAQTIALKCRLETKQIDARMTDFVAELEAAKHFEKQGRLPDMERRLKSAILAHIAVVNGVVLTMFKVCFPSANASRATPNVNKLDELCWLANRRNGTSVKPIEIRFIPIWNSLLEPDDVAATIAELNMPSPSEVEQEEARTSKFFAELITLLWASGGRFQLSMTE